MSDPSAAGRSARRWWALGALTLAVLAVGLDGTILSVALPTLAGALHASETDLQWFSSGYLLVLGAAMLPAGLLGDRYGRKKVLVSGLALFAVGSAACAWSTSTAEFLAARALLGLAGAAVIVMALSALTVLFTEDERPKAVGVWAAANFVALPIGPILGGWLLTRYWWGWVFLLNVPVAAVGLVAAGILVPESRSPTRPGVDVVGIVASVTGLVALTYGLIEAGKYGWTNPGAVALMVGGVGLLVVFLAWERRLNTRPGGQALIEFDLFSSRSYTWGVILAAVAVVAMIGVIFTMPQYFQGVVGTDAMGSGLRLLPLIGGLIVGALPADRVARVVGAKITVAGGFAVLAAGLLLGATTTLGSGTGFVAVWMVVVGFGMGLTMATASSAVMTEVPEERSGVGSAVMQAVNKTAAPFGSAVLGSVLLDTYRSRLDLARVPSPAAAAIRSSVFDGVAVAHRTGSAALLESVRTSFLHGVDAALLVSAGAAVVGMVLAVAFLPGNRTPRRDRPRSATEGALVTTH
ncbi:MAG: MFS transporter [Acidimicrobiales bacterium]